MRIITGKYGGRKINPPSKMPHTRPTTDITKEGSFNIIGNNISIPGIKTLDIFGGTGSISYALKNIDDLPKIIREQNLLKKNGWFILEHTPANNYENELLFKTMRNYGTTVFSIFVNNLKFILRPIFITGTGTDV